MSEATSGGGWLRPGILALFLTCTIVAGGSSTGAFYANAALQVISCLVIAWSLWDSRLNPMSRAGWLALCLGGALTAIILAQLVLLPPDVWLQLPGRQIVADGFAAIGAPLPSLPLTMTSDETIFGLLKFLPALAAFSIAAKLSGPALLGSLPWVVLFCAVLSVVVGLGQVFLGPQTPLYLYEFTNWGQPVGFMANANHQAALLVMALPFGALIISRLASETPENGLDLGLAVIVWILMAIVVLGVLMAGSVAGYGLLAPSLLLSVLIGRGNASGRVTTLGIVGVSIAIAVIGAVVASSPRLVGLGATSLTDDYLSRPDTYRRTLEAIGETMPAGTGLGSFQSVFPAYEDPDEVTSTQMNHAHNDYLEFVLEMGVAGIVLIAALLIWFLWRAFVIWTHDKGQGSRLRRAASVALLIVIIHSAVDYPLRTAAISAFAGLCLGIMSTQAEPSRRHRRVQAESDRPRHVVI